MNEIVDCSVAMRERDVRGECVLQIAFFAVMLEYGMRPCRMLAHADPVGFIHDIPGYAVGEIYGLLRCVAPLLVIKVVKVERHGPVLVKLEKLVDRQAV